MIIKTLHLKNIFFVFAVAYFICDRTFAGMEVDNALEQINNSAAFGLSLFNLNYDENFLATDNSQAKNTESGMIWGYAFNARATFWKNIYTDIYVDYYNRELEFDGTRKGAYQTGTGDFWNRFINANLNLGYVFTFTENHVLQAIPYAGIGCRFWYRDHNDVQAAEKYKNYKAIGGLKLNWLVTDNFILSPYLEAGKIFHASVANGSSYNLGSEPIYAIGLEINYRVFDEFFLAGFVNYSQFKYGRPDGGAQFESKTGELKGGLEVRYSWMID